MIYLATPYSSPSNVLVERRYRVALAVTAALAKEQYVVYSPIVHWHEVARKFKLPTSAAFWWNVNKEFLDAAQTLVIVSAPGWQESKGVKQEAAYAEALHTPILWFDPRSKTLALLQNPVNLRILLGEPPTDGENLPQRDVGRGSAS